ncbi:hypothetical protein KCU92_g9702, partial [Aureobasidium melanogenum]
MTGLPDLLGQGPLDVSVIADVQRLRTIQDPLSGMRMVHEHLHRGVLVMEIQIVKATTESKSIRLDEHHRVAIVGQDSKTMGRVAMMTIGKSDGRALVSGGLDMGNLTIDQVHWCNGLAIKHVLKKTPRGKPGVVAAKRDLKDARKDLVKKLLDLIIDKEVDWSALDWRTFDGVIDEMQPYLRDKSAPKRKSHPVAKKSTQARVPLVKSKGSKKNDNKSSKLGAEDKSDTSEEEVKRIGRKKKSNTSDKKAKQTGPKETANTVEGLSDRFKAKSIFDVGQMQQAQNALPAFTVDMFGFLSVQEARRANDLTEVFLEPFRQKDAKDTEFVSLMNKAYPHAYFTQNILDAFYRLKKERAYEATYLEDVPEHVEWWRQAHVRPTAGKTLVAVQSTMPMPPFLKGFCRWALSLGAPRKRTGRDMRKDNEIAGNQTYGHFRQSQIKKEADSKPQYHQID